MKRNIDQLRPHHKHESIYHTPKNIKEEWNDLYSSIEEEGLLYPLIITKTNTIISGVRRFFIVKEIGWKDIEVKVFEGSEEEIEVLLITSNANREKTHAEKVNEALHMLSIIGNRQGKRNLPEDEKGSRYEIVARKLGSGFSKDNVAKLAKIQEHDNKHPDEPQKLIDLVKEGAPIHAVHLLLSIGENEENDIEKIIEKEGKYKLINDDSKRALDTIGDGEIDMCFTSFPYWKLRLYDIGEVNTDGQNWGEENTIEEYIKTSVEISKKVYQKLKNTGSFYLNLGDTIINRQHLFIPEKVCMAIMNIGFKLVNKIIWRVKNKKPGNFDKQLVPTYEFVYQFVKDVDLFKNRVIRYKTGDKIRVSGCVGDRINKRHKNKNKKKKMIITPYSRFRNFIEENEGFKDVIVSSVASSKETQKITGIDHPAVFPETLPLLAILQSTSVGDVVMDVCSGSGTLGICNLLGRRYVGIEISEEYHKCAVKRLEYFNSVIDENEIYEFESLVEAA